MTPDITWLPLRACPNAYYLWGSQTVLSDVKQFFPSATIRIPSWLMVLVAVVVPFVVPSTLHRRGRRCCRAPDIQVLAVARRFVSLAASTR
jgi:hypothetical protein